MQYDCDSLSVALTRAGGLARDFDALWERIWQQDHVPPRSLDLCRMRLATLHGTVAEAGRIAGHDVSRETLRAAWGEREADAVIEQAEIAIKYAGYIDKQVDEVERASALESLKLPEELDYAQVTALSFEVRQKLARHRPATLGQASRISGVTPAAISLLLVHLERQRRERAA